MKKRVKLLTTIASLCLAVALMAFGVYAATTAGFNVTGTVSFTAANDVYLEFVDVEYHTSSKLNVTDAADASWVSATVTADESGATGWTTVDTNGAPKATVVDGTITGVTYAFKNAAGSDAAIYGYKVVLTFKVNHDMSTLKVALTDTQDDANVNYASTAAWHPAAGEAANFTADEMTAEFKTNDTVVVTIVCSLKDAAVSVATLEASTEIDFSRTQPQG